MYETKKNKIKGFTLIEVLVTISLIGLLTSLGIKTYSNIMLESSEKLLYSQIVNLEWLLESYTIMNKILEKKDEDWKMFQKIYFWKKRLFTIPNKIKEKKIYYKIQNNNFCIWFKVKSDFLLKKAKNDDWAINNYIEVCNGWKTNINLDKEEWRYIIKSNYY